MSTLLKSNNACHSPYPPVPVCQPTSAKCPFYAGNKKNPLKSNTSSATADTICPTKTTDILTAAARVIRKSGTVNPVMTPRDRTVVSDYQISISPRGGRSNEFLMFHLCLRETARILCPTTCQNLQRGSARAWVGPFVVSDDLRPASRNSPPSALWLR